MKFNKLQEGFKSPSVLEILQKYNVASMFKAIDYFKDIKFKPFTYKITDRYQLSSDEKSDIMTDIQLFMNEHVITPKYIHSTPEAFGITLSIEDSNIDEFDTLGTNLIFRFDLSMYMRIIFMIKSNEGYMIKQIKTFEIGEELKSTQLDAAVKITTLSTPYNLYFNNSETPIQITQEILDEL